MAGLYGARKALFTSGTKLTPEEIEAEQAAVVRSQYNDFSGGLASAATGMVGSTKAYAASGLDALGAKDAARGLYAGAAEDARNAGNVAPEIATTDQITDFSTGARYVAGKLGGAAGSLPPALLGGVAGRLATRSGLGALAGSTAAYQPVMAGGHVQEINANPNLAGMDPTEKFLRGTGVGTTQAVLEGVGPAYMANRLFKRNTPATSVGGALRNAGTDVLKGAALEGAGAAGSDVLGQAGMIQADPTMEYDGRQTFEAGIGEAVGGAGFAAPGAVVSNALDYANAGKNAAVDLAGRGADAASERAPGAIDAAGKAADAIKAGAQNFADAGAMFKNTASGYLKHPELAKLVATQDFPPELDGANVEQINAWLASDNNDRRQAALNIAQRTLIDREATETEKATAQALLDNPNDVDSWKPFAGGMILKHQQERLASKAGAVRSKIAGWVEGKLGKTKSNLERTPQDDEYFSALRPLLVSATGVQDAAALDDTAAMVREFLLSSATRDEAGWERMPSELTEAFGERTPEILAQAYDALRRQGLTRDIKTKQELTFFTPEVVKRVVGKQIALVDQAVKLVDHYLTPTALREVPDGVYRRDISSALQHYLRTGKTDPSVEADLDRMFGANKDELVEKLAALNKQPQSSLGHGPVDAAASVGQMDDVDGAKVAAEGETGADANMALEDDYNSGFSELNTGGGERYLTHTLKKQPKAFDRKDAFVDEHVRIARKSLALHGRNLQRNRVTNEDQLKLDPVGVVDYASETGDRKILDELIAAHPELSHEDINSRFFVMRNEASEVDQGEAVDVNPIDLEISATRKVKDEKGKEKVVDNPSSWQARTRIDRPPEQGGNIDVSTLANGRLYLTKPGYDKPFVTSARKLIEKMWDAKKRGAFDEKTSDKNGAADKMAMFASGLTSLMVAGGFSKIEVKTPDGEMFQVDSADGLPDAFALWDSNEAGAQLTLGQARGLTNKAFRAKKQKELKGVEPAPKKETDTLRIADIPTMTRTELREAAEETMLAMAKVSQKRSPDVYDAMKAKLEAFREAYGKRVTERAPGEKKEQALEPAAKIAGTQTTTIDRDTNGNIFSKATAAKYAGKNDRVVKQGDRWVVERDIGHKVGREFEHLTETEEMAAGNQKKFDNTERKFDEETGLELQPRDNSTKGLSNFLQQRVTKLRAEYKALAEQVAEYEGKEQARVAPAGTRNVYFGSGENASLSNLADRAFEHDGRSYRSVEHAYQALKSGAFDPDSYARGKTMRKAAGRLGTKTEGNWNLLLMKQLVSESFSQNQEAKAALLATGADRITHTQDKGVWGREFPRILAEVRTELGGGKPVAPRNAVREAALKRGHAKLAAMIEQGKKLAAELAKLPPVEPKPTSSPRAKDHVTRGSAIPAPKPMPGVDIKGRDLVKGKTKNNMESTKRVAANKALFSGMVAEAGLHSDGAKIIVDGLLSPRTFDTADQLRAYFKKSVTDAKTRAVEGRMEGDAVSTDRWVAIAKIFEKHAELAANDKYSLENPTGKTLTTEQKAELSERLEKMLGPKVALLITDQLQGSGEWSRDVNNQNAAIKIATTALNPLSVLHHEAMHEFFQRLLDGKYERAANVLRNAADSPLIKRQLQRHFAGQTEVLEQIENDVEERIAYMFQLWASGKLDIGTQTETVFRKIINIIRKTLGLISQEKQLEAILQSFYDGKMAEPSAMAQVLDSQEARAKYLKKIGAKANPALKKANEWVGFAENALTGNKNPHLDWVGRQMNNKTGSKGDAQGFLSAKEQANNLYMNKFANALKGVDATGKDKRTATKADVDLALEGLQTKTTHADPVVARVQEQVIAVFKEMYEYMGERGVKVFNPETKAWDDVREIKDYRIPVSWDPAKIIEESGRFKELLLEHHLKELEGIAKKANKEVADGKDAGDYTASWDKKQNPDNKEITAEDVANAIVARLINANGQSELKEDSTALGFSPFAKSVNERTLDWIDQSVFAEFQEKDIVKIISSYVGQVTKRGEYSHRFGADGAILQEKMDAAMNFEINDIMESKYGVKDARKTAMDKARGINVMAKKAGSSVQTTWQEQLGRLAGEGVDGKDIISDAVNNLEPARRAIMAMEGTLGHDISALARKASAYTIVYQNVRLLGYALFSNVIDPLGMMVRGAEFKDAYAAFKRGMRDVGREWGSLTGLRDAKETDNDEAVRVAEMIGTVDSSGFMSQMGTIYGSQYLPAWAKNVNDTFFRWNGLEAFNKAMRVQATQAAISFIKRHHEKPNDHSKRYFEELGLVDGDVQLGPNGELNVDNRQVQQAVMRWVDGAILRPNAAIRPTMSSDPHYAVFYHLKQFMYAMHAVILKRVQIEIKNGNTDPLILLLAGYVPLMLAADAAKGLIQEATGGGAPYWQHDSMGGILAHGVQRAGLLGVGQLGVDVVGHGPADLFGPMAGQAADLVTQPLGESVAEAVAVGPMSMLTKGVEAAESAKGEAA